MTEYALVITVEAENDLDNLYEDGFKRWGEAQADKYYDDLLAHFDALCDNPYLSAQWMKFGLVITAVFAANIQSFIKLRMTQCESWRWLKEKTVIPVESKEGVSL